MRSSEIATIERCSLAQLRGRIDVRKGSFLLPSLEPRICLESGAHSIAVVTGTRRHSHFVPRAVVSRCSNVKPKSLDYLVGNGLTLPGFADTAAFDATLVNLGFGPQLRPQQVRPLRRAVSSVPALPLWSR